MPGTSISVNSPYFTVDPATLAREQIAAPYPIVSVEVAGRAECAFRRLHVATPVKLRRDCVRARRDHDRSGRDFDGRESG